MEQMQSVIIGEYGGPEVLRFETVDVPAPVPTEVQVRVDYAGINPVDGKTRQGGKMGAVAGGPPLPLGWDVAGTVTEVGMGVTRFAVGDRVYGMPRFPYPAAAYSEYLTAPARQLVEVPAGLSLSTAAAVPLPATTAYQIVVDVAEVRAGQRVLVLGASGAVGRFAVQLAKGRGAHVIGTASTGKLAGLTDLGVDQAIDYTSQRFEDAVDAVDVVIDLVGGEYSERAISVTAAGGLVVSVPSGDKSELAARAAAAGVRLTGMIVEPDHVALEAVSAGIEAGTISVAEPEVLPFAEVAAAHRKLDAGAGRMVLRVRG